MKKLKIIFFGSSNFSFLNLCKIFELKEFEILCIITKKDNIKNSRNKNKNLIKIFSIQNNINLLQPDVLNENISDYLYKLKPDLIIVVSYGLLIPKIILEIPKFGCINLHCSILPKWKGPSPIYWSILSGDKKSGITILKINSKLDSGNIILQKKCPIESRETYISLQNKLLKIGYESLIKILFKFLKREFIYEKIQSNKKFKYARKINKKIDSKIDWFKSSIQIDRCIRAYNLWPGNYFYYKEKLIKVWSSEILTYKKNKYNIGEILFIDKSGIGINTGKGILQINIIQFPNKNKINIKDYINSNNLIFKLGDILK